MKKKKKKKKEKRKKKKKKKKRKILGKQLDLNQFPRNLKVQLLKEVTTKL